jgi:hypothetical protein
MTARRVFEWCCAIVASLLAYLVLNDFARTYRVMTSPPVYQELVSREKLCAPDYPDRAMLESICAQWAKKAPAQPRPGQ